MGNSRRQFLKVAGAVTAGLLHRQARGGVPASEPKPSIGLQLYVMRGEFAKNVPETIKTIGQLGYQGVEFWGYQGTPNVFQEYTAKQLRKLLDDNGLQCCGMHVELKGLEADQLSRTLENNQILGNRFVILASARIKMGSQKTIEELAALLNGVSEKCRARDMRVGYHAHPFDFTKIDGRFAWDILFSQTRPEIIMQMDVANCLAGRGDPIAMLEKFPGRALSMHMREYKEKTFDSQYYMDVLRLCRTLHKTQWYIVEQGGTDGMGFDVPRQALASLRQFIGG